MGTPMKGFFDGVDVVAEAMATAAPVTVQGVPTKTLIPSAKLVPVEEGTHTERVSELPIPAKTPTPQKGPASSTASSATPLVISTSDPFLALSQAVKDGSSLVVTPSYIPSSATRGPDVDLSFEGLKEVLEDSDEEEGDEYGVKAMGMYLLLPLSSFYTYLHNLLMQYQFILHIYPSDSQRLLRNQGLHQAQHCL